MRKHRIIERLLTDFMGYTAAEAHVHADELGGTFTDDMVERIEEKLGHPDRCPHGWPVDPDFEQAENRELEPLSALEPGASATIVRLAEHDGDLLHWFYDEGLVARDDRRAARRRAGRGPVPRHVNGGEKAIGEKAAAGLFVKRVTGPDSAQPNSPEARLDRTRDRFAAANQVERTQREPAAARSASALSVRSHVKSWSSRPKWPYAAVFG